MVRVASTITAGLALAALAAAPAAAGDDDDEALRWPRRSVAVTLGGSASYVGDQSVGGFGLTGEVARGFGRWQALVDGRAAWTFGDQHRDGGPALAVDVGARWLARSFSPDSSAALQLALEFGAGVEHIALPSGSLTRPLGWVGWAWQVRALGDHPRITVRFELRVVVAPALDRARAAQVLCRGTCGPARSSSPIDDGLVGGLGVAW